MLKKKRNISEITNLSKNTIDRDPTEIKRIKLEHHNEKKNDLIEKKN